VDPAVVDPAVVDPAVVDPAVVDPAVADPVAVGLADLLETFPQARTPRQLRHPRTKSS
jgi:hypothetical protein